MRENGANRARKELLPVRASHLIHALATHEQAVVIPSAREAPVAVVDIEAIAQPILGGSPGFHGVVETGMTQSDNSGTGHAARAHVASVDRVAESAVRARECAAHV